MKTIISAIALVLAVPAMAQTAQATDPHAGHAEMKGHSQHQAEEHDCKACCEKMKQADGKMDCMEKKGDAKPAAPDTHSHEGHDH